MAIVSMNHSPSPMKTYPSPSLQVATIALVVAMAAACSKLDQITTLPPPGTSAGTLQGDKAVASKVRAALLNNAVLSDFDITVSAVNGDVRLRGFVDTQAHIDQAIKLARGVDGVHAIHDELRIAQAEELAATTGTSIHTRSFKET